MLPPMDLNIMIKPSSKLSKIEEVISGLKLNCSEVDIYCLFEINKQIFPNDENV